MIDNIIGYSLRHKLTVAVGAILIVIGGIVTSREMDIDVFPDLTAPTVVVMTDAHGLTAEEMETSVTFHIETALNGATNVRRVRSATMSGYSFVWAEFDWGMDVYRARQIVSEKMVALGDVLPEGIVPTMAPQSSIMGEIMFVGLQSDSTSMMDLRNIAEWVVKPNILSTGGVSQVTIIGGDEKEYQVIADPVRMRRYGVGMQELERALTTLSENTNGGVVRDYGNEYALRGMGRTTDIDEMGRALIKNTEKGAPICVGDVAEIRIGAAVKMGYASRNARPAVLLSVSKQPNINTLSVTEAIETNLAEIGRSLPADIKLDTHVFRQADFIEASVSNVGEALYEGAIFVILVLIIFLGSFRTTIISLTAIPLSLLGTMIILYAMGMDVNTMTLGGMCIAIGSLVDDAIIDVENVYKRLRENHAKEAADRRPTLTVVFEASKEIRTSIINATLIIMVAFIPLFFLTGMEGRMLKPLGLTYIVSLFVSLIVAMTVTPLLCHTMLSSEGYLTRKERDNRLTTSLKSGYARALSWALDHGRMVGIATVILMLTAVGIFSTLGSSFLPDFNEGSMTISAVTQPGVSLDVANELGNAMERELKKIPEVRTTSRRTGRGELDEHSQATNSAEIDVNFELSDRPREEIFADVRERLSALPGVAVTVGQPLGHRIDHILSGTRANIAIKIFGTDLPEIYMIGNRVKSAISEIPGCVDVTLEQQTETPQLQVRPRREVMARYGISMEEFNQFITSAFGGERVGEIYEGQRRYDMTLRQKGSDNQTVEGVGEALLVRAGGVAVPLSEIAEIRLGAGPNSIMHENAQRRIVVSANASGRDVGSVVDDIEKKIAEEIQLPEGYRIEYGGQFESAKRANRTLSIATAGAIGVIFLLLMGEFGRARLAGVVMASLPLALIGGVMAIWMTSGVVSIPATIGFITLFGVATRNGVLLVSKYEKLSEGMGLREAITAGSIDRLSPILMTALTSALALIPLVMNGDKSGNEIQSPMAIVVLGGLLTSTLLNLFVMPLIYKKNREKR